MRQHIENETHHTNGAVSVATLIPEGQMMTELVHSQSDLPPSPQEARISGRGALERRMIDETERTTAVGTRAIARIGTAVTAYAAETSGNMLNIRDAAPEGSEGRQVMDAFVEQNLPGFLNDLGKSARTASGRIAESVSHDHHDGVDRAPKQTLLQRVGFGRVKGAPR